MGRRNTNGVNRGRYENEDDRVTIKPFSKEKGEQLSKLQKSFGKKIKPGTMVGPAHAMFLTKMPKFYNKVNRKSLDSTYTELSIARYAIAKGMPMRTQLDHPEVIGYCVENPLEVLDIVFPDYHVTNVMGYQLFDSCDNEESTPMIGLRIKGHPIVKGIKGTLAELVEEDDVQALKREELVDRNLINKISKQLTDIYKNSSIRDARSYKQIKHDLNKIVKTIKGSVI